jgi:hypothetical protein
MNAEIDRLKQDLKIIEEAVGCEPEFDRRHVWMCLGWGIASLVMIFMCVFPHLIPLVPWGRIIFMVLFVGLPVILCRLFVPELPSLSVYRCTSNVSTFLGIGSWVSSLIGSAFLILFVFWLSKVGATPEIKIGSIGVLAGSCCVVHAWGKPWRYWALILGLAVVTIGLITPLVPHGYGVLTIVTILALASFAGALILHRQLEAYNANGKAAH